MQKNGTVTGGFGLKNSGVQEVPNVVDLISVTATDGYVQQCFGLRFVSHGPGTHTCHRPITIRQRLVVKN